MKPELISIAEFARRIKREYRYVHGRIQRSGLLNGNGKLEWHQAKKWWDMMIQIKHAPYRYQNNSTISNSTSHHGIPAIHESQARKEAAMAELRELEAAEKRGELIDKQKAGKTIFQFARQARDIFLAIPRRVSGVIAMETDQRVIQQLLEQEIERGLRALEHVKL